MPAFSLAVFFCLPDFFPPVLGVGAVPVCLLGDGFFLSLFSGACSRAEALASEFRLEPVSLVVDLDRAGLFRARELQPHLRVASSSELSDADDAWVLVFSHCFAGLDAVFPLGGKVVSLFLVRIFSSWGRW